MAFTPAICATCGHPTNAHAPDCFWVRPLNQPAKAVIRIDKADAALLSEAYRYSQFSPDAAGMPHAGCIHLAPTILAALRRVLDAIDNQVHPKE